MPKTFKTFKTDYSKARGVLLRTALKYGTLKRMQNHLKLNYHTLRYRLISLVDEGLLYKNNTMGQSFYGLTQAGVEFLGNESSMGARNFKTWRKHRIHFTFKIIHKPEGWEHTKPKIIWMAGDEYRQAKLNNTTIEYLDIYDFTVKLTTKKVVIYMQPVFGKTPEETDCKTMEELDKRLPRLTDYLERKYGIVIKLHRIGEATETADYARENDEMANHSHSVLGKPIASRDRHGELRAISDKSSGSPEMEFVHPVHAREDAGYYDKLIADLLEGYINPYQNKEDIGKLYSMVNNLQKLALQKSLSSTKSTIGDEGVGVWN